MDFLNYLFENKFDDVLIGMSILAVFVFVALFFIKAGYGRFQTRKWGFAFSNKLAWFIMEAPVFILMLLLWLNAGDRMWRLPHLIFFLIFQTHYLQRAFIFPFMMRGKSKMPFTIVLMGFVFNSVNAFMQGGWIFYVSPDEMYDVSWLYSPQFIIGTLIFIAGMVINLQSDYIIRHLRKPGQTGHYLPEGGMFRYVSSANYFGEFMEWVGFAVLTWSLAGAVFALWTFANLGPRADAIYKSYDREFGEKFRKRHLKRILPFIW